MADTKDTPERRETIAHNHLQLANEHFDKGRLDDALSQLDKAIALTPTPEVTSAYLVIKGRFLTKCGFHDECVAACEEAIGLTSKNYYAWLQMGRVHYRLARCRDAARCFTESASLKPDHNVYTLLGNAQLTFDPRAALVSAEKALELDPSWDEAIRVRDSARRWIRCEESEDGPGTSGDVSEADDAT